MARPDYVSAAYHACSSLTVSLENSVAVSKILYKSLESGDSITVFNILEQAADTVQQNQQLVYFLALTLGYHGHPEAADRLLQHTNRNRFLD